MKLNPMQEKAVKTVNGSVLVIAGAGSGKTRVLTNRIANLIMEEGVYPNNILAFTFTNKAAEEMKSRIYSLVGSDAGGMWIGTFHSICVRLLRKYAEKIGFDSNFVIYDVSEQKSLIKKILKEKGIKVDVGVFYSFISNAKSKNYAPEYYSGNFAYVDESSVYQIYQNRLKSSNAFDFDDLINYTLTLLTQEDNSNDRPLDFVRNKFKYIHVDEFQDTNASQYELIRLISGKFDNVFAVGDYDQSIYKWRGAEINNIKNFEKEFKNTTVIMLEQNYRSTQNILSLANSVIKNNQRQYDKKLWTDSKKEGSIEGYHAYNDIKEAEFVVESIKNRIRFKECKPSDNAILYRSHANSRLFEEKLIEYGIPYKIYGGLGFYDRKEIKDVLAYLKLVVNPYDDISFERIINEPKRGIGDKSLEVLQKFAREYNFSLLQASGKAYMLNSLSKRACNQFLEFYEMMNKISQDYMEYNAIDIFDKVIDLTKIIEKYELEGTVEADARIDNINEFKNSIARRPNIKLNAFLDYVSLATDAQGNDDVDDSEKVLLMTIHAAKGLEFKNVYMVAMEKGNFPSFRAETNEDIEEERRLCYVAITRAEENLTISYSQQRMMFGRMNFDIQPSEFIEEMDLSLITSVGVQTFGANLIEDDFNKIQKSKIGYKDQLKQLRPEKSVYNEVDKGHFSIGDKVSHEKYGTGIVLAINLEKNILTIFFDSEGQKKISPNFAPIKKIN